MHLTFYIDTEMAEEKRNRTMKKAALLTVGLVVGLVGLARAAVELIPYRIEESRNLTLVKDSVQYPADEMKITFSLNGPDVDSFVRYGELKLDEAVDDQGTNLIPKKDPFNRAAKFQDFSNAFFRKMALKQKQTADPPQVELRLTSAKRTATKIAHLRGTLSLAQAGTIKAIEVSGLKTLGTKKLDVPAEAGIAITVTAKPDASKEIHSIELEITGDANALDSIAMVDAAGKEMSNGSSSWSAGGTDHKTLDLEKPLDDSMKLVVKISMDRKTLQVPFDLKDIALP